jgi:hypothetical protein
MSPYVIYGARMVVEQSRGAKHGRDGSREDRTMIHLRLSIFGLLRRAYWHRTAHQCCQYRKDVIHTDFGHSFFDSHFLIPVHYSSPFCLRESVGYKRYNRCATTTSKRISEKCQRSRNVSLHTSHICGTE